MKYGVMKDERCTCIALLVIAKVSDSREKARKACAAAAMICATHKEVDADEVIRESDRLVDEGPECFFKWIAENSEGLSDEENFKVEEMMHDNVHEPGHA